MTYRELDERTTRLAHGLSDLGVRVGDHVGLLMHDRAEHVEAMLACYKLRAVPINVNWRYTGDELTYLFEDAGLGALVCEPELRPEHAPDVIIETGDRYERLVRDSSPARDFGPRSRDDRYILYTGGTTGMPKGVVWRHGDITTAVIRDPAARLAPHLPPGAEAPDQIVQLSLGPLMHASGQWSALGALCHGGKVILFAEQHVDLGRVLQLVERERIVSLNIVGDVHAVPLLKELRAERYDTSSLCLLGSGGAMLSSQSKQQLLERIPSLLAISEAIGSSEAPVEAASVATRDGAPPSLTFAARPETAVFNDDLCPVVPGSGEVGRVAVRGPVPLGYHNDPEKSARTFVTVNGVRWSLPGDMATVEADGTIRLLGRGALCINSGGEKVYPEEVEAVLKTHPDVADALVIGRPHPRLGEQVVAVVQPTDGRRLPSLEALQAHCRGHLAGYKVPRAVHAVGRVERSPSGKPDYRWARAVVIEKG